MSFDRFLLAFYLFRLVSTGRDWSRLVETDRDCLKVVETGFGLDFDCVSTGFYWFRLVFDCFRLVETG